MRRARITYPGAIHHIMNRGHDGIDIFSGNRNKSQFLDFLAESAKKYKMRIFAYCVMDNHYHLILENTSGKMSECLKHLNGLYGMYYRKVIGGKGYVFQNRFKSTLIENDAYLLQSIAYLLRNPVRAGIVRDAEGYPWSSTKSYYSTTAERTTTGSTDDIVDAEFVNDLFGNGEELKRAIESIGVKEPPVILTEFGEVLGSEDFFKSALKKYDRRTRPSTQSFGVQRQDERYFDPVEKVIWEFEQINGIQVEDIDISTLEGKRQRGELLVFLKDQAGLTYKEIGKLDIFGFLKFNSLRGIYKNIKRKGLYSQRTKVEV